MSPQSGQPVCAIQVVPDRRVALPQSGREQKKMCVILYAYFSVVGSYRIRFRRCLLAHLALHGGPQQLAHDREDNRVSEVDRHRGATRGEANQHTGDQEVEQRGLKKELPQHFCLLLQQENLRGGLGSKKIMEHVL